MIPPLQSLVRYDNATLVSTIKDRLGASKLSKSPGKVSFLLPACSMTGLPTTQGTCCLKRYRCQAQQQNADQHSTSLALPGNSGCFQLGQGLTSALLLLRRKGRCPLWSRRRA